MKNGPPVITMTTQSEIRKKACPTTSITLRAVFGSPLLTMSIRMCSLSSKVHGEQSRKTMLKSTHCSSSHELDEMSSVLRKTALTADITTATRISQARRLPVHFVNASIPRLSFKSACNGNPPNSHLSLVGANRAQRLVQPGYMRPSHQ